MPGTPAVEAEDEFIEVGLEVLGGRCCASGRRRLRVPMSAYEEKAYEHMAGHLECDPHLQAEPNVRAPAGRAGSQRPWVSSTMHRSIAMA